MIRFNSFHASRFQRVFNRIPLYLGVVAASYLSVHNNLHAGPDGGVVTGGEGSIVTTGNTTNVQQMTDRMSVQWQNFNLAGTDTVNFFQPNSSSLVLNHILQNGPSQIAGSINANGHVLLINPRGVIFGESSVINVGALTASTLWMSRDDFLNGDLILKALDGNKGVVVNSGLISAASGGVTLLGEGVSNEGLITAQLGYVNLVSGREAYLTFDEEGFLGVNVTADVADNLLGEHSSVQNSGEINASGGKVILQANVSSALFDSAVNNSGIIEATGFNSGSGGTVHLLGDTVTVSQGALISVNGFSGGGEILIGGDYQGGNPAVDNARLTTVAKDTLLSANATANGDGGKVILWADNTTRFEGHIEARGGTVGGDGGFAEVSGKQYLQISGHADLSASTGTFGTLLLDPGTVTIKKTGSSAPADPPNRNVIKDGWINTQLDTGALIVTTTEASGGGPEAINFDAGVDIDIGDDDLTFIAGQDIQLNDAAFTGSGTGEVLFQFGQTTAGVFNLDEAEFTSVNASITGGANKDTIVGANQYVVTAPGVGTADDIAYSLIENLTGTAGSDTFALTAGSIENLSGLGNNDTFSIVAATFIAIDGGTGINDTVSFANAVDLDLAATPISNVATVNANAAAGDVLRGGSAYLFTTATRVEVDGDSSRQYNGFETLVGTTGDDVFELAGFTFAGAIDGLGELGGGDTIAGSTAFEVTAGGIGSAGTATFSGIENLTGTAAADTFTLTAGAIGNLLGLGANDSFDIVGGTFTGIDGGAGTAGTVSFANAVDLDLAATPISNVATVNANAAAGDVLRGGSAYLFTTATRVEVDGDSSRQYNGFETLVGTTGDDVFDLAGFAFAGAIDGLGELGGGDTVAGSTAFEVTAGGIGSAGTATFSGIENLTGTAATDTFTLTAGAIGNLLGLGANDSFDIVDGTFTAIDGGVGTAGTVSFANAVDLDLAATPISNVATVNADAAAGDVLRSGSAYLFTTATRVEVDGDSSRQYNGFETLVGTTGDDVFDLAGFAFAGSIDGLAAAAAGDTLAGSTAFEVTAGGIGSAGTATFSGIENLTGTAAADTFTLTAGAIGNLLGLGANDSFDIVGGTFTAIDGGAGTAGTVSFANAVDLDLAATPISNVATVNADAAAGDVLRSGSAYLFTTATRVEVGGDSTRQYNGFETLVGTTGDDVFDLAGFAFAGAIDGLGELGGGDTVAGSTAFEVTAGGIGSAGTATFSGIENLTGTAAADTFTLTAGAIGNLLGLGANDSFDIVGGTFTAIDGGVGTAGTVSFANAVDLDLAATPISNVATVDADAAAGDVLRSGSAYLFTTATRVEVDGDSSRQYNGFETLVGTTGDDVFDLAGFAFAGSIDGLAAAAAGDTLAGSTDYEVTATGIGSAGTTPFTGIENLTGTAGVDNFSLTAGSIGKLLGLGDNDTFDIFAGTFSSIAGGAGAGDTVNYVNSVDLSLAANPLGTVEVVNANAVAGNILRAGTAYLFKTNTRVEANGNTNIQYNGFESLIGTGNTDVFDLAGFAFSGSISGLGGSDTLAGSNDYEVTADGTGSAGLSNFSGIENLTGTAGTDSFSLTAGSIGSLQGLGASDTFDIFVGTFSAIDGGTGANDVVNFVNSVDLDPATTPVIAVAQVNATAVGGNVLRNVSAYLFKSATAVETDGNTNTRYDGFESLMGTASDDVFDLAGFAFSGSIDGLGESIDGDTLAGSADYDLTDTGKGSAGVSNFIGIENLTGTAGDDNFSLTVGSISSLSGLGGNDTFDIFAGTFTSIDGGDGASDKVNYANTLDLDPTTTTLSTVEVVNANAIGGDVLRNATAYLFKSATAVEVAGNTATQYNGFETLIGTANDDIFDLAGFAFSGFLEGSGEGLLGDTVVGSVAYQVTSDGEGSAGLSTFMSIENLTGTANADIFTLTSGAMMKLVGLAGDDQFNISAGTFASIDGGVGGNDVVNYVNVVDLDPATTTPISNVAEVNAAAIGGDVLRNASAYLFKSATAVEADGNTATRYNGFETLIGTEGSDVFDLAGFIFEGFMDGLGSTVGAGDTVAGSTTYDITDTGEGKAGSSSFNNIENLIGTESSDTFTLTSGSIMVLEGLGDNDLFNIVDGTFAAIDGGDGSEDAVNYVNVVDLDTAATTPITNVALVNAAAMGGDVLRNAAAYLFRSATAVEADGNTVTLYAGFETLVGTAGNDVFDLAGFAFTGTLDGGIGTGDIIVGSAAYEVTGNGSGTAGSSSFSAIENLTGTANADSFRLTAGSIGVLSGLGGEDTFTLGTATFTSLDGGADTDALVGGNTFNVNGEFSGTVDSRAFIAIENLTGNADANIFTLTSGTIGDLDGSGGNDSFTLGAATFTSLDGGSDTDDLIGGSSFEVTGDNSGTANGSDFVGIENLIGDDDVNTFALSSGSIGDLSGLGENDTFTLGAATFTSLDGGTGTDTLIGGGSFEVTGDFSGTADGNGFVGIENLIGDADSTTFTLTSGMIAVVDGAGGDDRFNLGTTTFTVLDGGSGIDTVIGGSNFEVTGDFIGLANGNSFVSIENLTGDSTANTFTLTSGTIGALDGAGGDDSFTLGDATFTSLNGGLGTDALLQGISFEVTGDYSGTANGEAFAGIENLTGDVGDNTFTLTSGTIGDLNGLAGNDTFQLNDGVILGVITGGADTDIIVGGSVYLVSLFNAGKVDDYDFAEIENLIGTAFDDVFSVASGGSLSGFMDGLAGLDLFDLSAANSTVGAILGGDGSADSLINNASTISLTGTGTFDAVNGLVAVSGVENVSMTGVLLASNASEAFEIAGSSGIILRSPAPEMSFTEVISLVGNGTDSLNTGGAGVQLLAAGFTVDGTRIGSISNISEVDNVDRLAGHTAGEIFSLRGNVVTVNSQGVSRFSGVNNLLGGGGNDTLNNDQAGATLIPGGFRTGANVEVSAIERVNATGDLTGSSAAESFSLVNGEFIIDTLGNALRFFGIDDLDGGAGDDTLRGATRYILTSLNGGTADGRVFRNIENLAGTAGNDTFVKSGGSLSGMIQGEGQSAGSEGEGDTLAGFASYRLNLDGSGRTEDDTVFDGIETLASGGSGSIFAQGDSSEFILTAMNSGTANGIFFNGVANLSGTDGDDTFIRREQGALSGLIDGLGDAEQGDSLENFSNYILGTSNLSETDSADGTAFQNVERLVGTDADGDSLSGAAEFLLTGGDSGVADNALIFEKIEVLVGTSGDDRLIGGSNFVLTGRNRGIVDDFFVFSDIENIVGTIGDDSFDFSNGFLDGTVRGALEAGVADTDTLIGLNDFVLDGDGQGIAAKRNASGVIESATRFEEIENLVGTLGSDTFNLAGYMHTGRIDGLGDNSDELEVDRIIIDQDAFGEGSQQNIAIDVTDSKSGTVRYGRGSAQFDYASIEDFQLNIRQDLIISGAGRLSSRSDINVAGSLKLDGATNGDTLTLMSAGNMTVDGNLLLLGRSIIDVSTEGTVLTIGSGISIDTASGAEINGLVDVNITEEPLIQLQVEETTSLSVFDDIDVYAAGRSSVARTEGSKLKSEGDLIEALTRAQ